MIKNEKLILTMQHCTGGEIESFEVDSEEQAYNSYYNLVGAEDMVYEINGKVMNW